MDKLLNYAVYLIVSDINNVDVKIEELLTDAGKIARNQKINKPPKNIPKTKIKLSSVKKSKEVSNLINGLLKKYKYFDWPKLEERLNSEPEIFKNNLDKFIKNLSNKQINNNDDITQLFIDNEIYNENMDLRPSIAKVFNVNLDEDETDDEDSGKVRDQLKFEDNQKEKEEDDRYLERQRQAEMEFQQEQARPQLIRQDMEFSQPQEQAKPQLIRQDMEFSQPQQPPQNVFNQVYQFIQNNILNNMIQQMRNPNFNLLQYRNERGRALRQYLINVGYVMFISFFTNILYNAINTIYNRFINTEQGGQDTFFTDELNDDEQMRGGQVQERDRGGIPGPFNPYNVREPTERPTEQPTEEPTQQPTEEPTQQPTEAPTEAPITQQPTITQKLTEAPANIQTTPIFYSVSPDPEIIPKTQPDKEVLSRFVFRDPIDKNNKLVQNQYNNLDKRFTDNFDFYNLQANLSNPTFEHQFVPNVKSNFDLYCLDDYNREAMKNYNARVEDVNSQISGGPNIQLYQKHRDYLSFSNRVSDEGTGFVINPSNHERMNKFQNVHVLPMSRHFQFLPHMQ
jgi:hypothetical protein